MSSRARTVTTAVVVLVLACAVAYWIGRQDPKPPAAAPAPTPSPTATTAPGETLKPKPLPWGCRTRGQEFTPTSIMVAGVTRNTRVLALPRDAHDVPGVPPTSDKNSFAWDKPGIAPNSAKGNVLLNTHTWPNGAAMGNRLLNGLKKGGYFELSNGKSSTCYRVTERTEVSIVNPPVERVYDFDGPPQAVIVVCSGVRRGPGDWSHRTLWFAEPVKSSVTAS